MESPHHKWITIYFHCHKALVDSSSSPCSSFLCWRINLNFWLRLLFARSALRDSFLGLFGMFLFSTLGNNRQFHKLCWHSSIFVRHWNDKLAFFINLSSFPNTLAEPDSIWDAWLSLIVHGAMNIPETVIWYLEEAFHKFVACWFWCYKWLTRSSK